MEKPNYYTIIGLLLILIIDKLSKGSVAYYITAVWLVLCVITVVITFISDAIKEIEKFKFKRKIKKRIKELKKTNDLKNHTIKLKNIIYEEDNA